MAWLVPFYIILTALLSICAPQGPNDDFMTPCGDDNFENKYGPCAKNVTHAPTSSIYELATDVMHVLHEFFDCTDGAHWVRTQVVRSWPK